MNVVLGSDQDGRAAFGDWVLLPMQDKFDSGASGTNYF